MYSFFKLVQYSCSVIHFRGWPRPHKFYSENFLHTNFYSVIYSQSVIVHSGLSEGGGGGGGGGGVDIGFDPPGSKFRVLKFVLPYMDVHVHLT